MAPKPATLCTIGYEDLTMDAFIAHLKKARVRVLIDVRAVPLSRKPGFSKNKLAGFLTEQGIDYVGLRGLGTPAEGRAAARKGQTAVMKKIFLKHLTTMEAMHDMQAAVNIATTVKSCLLCYEREAACCHRMIVAEKIHKKTGLKLEHLR